MPFQFTCPYCFHKTLVAENYAGQTGQCVNCGKQVTIPAATKESRASEPLPAPPSPTLPLPLTKRMLSPFGDYKRPLVTFGLRSLGLIAGIGVMAAIMFYVFWPSLVGLKARRDKAACMANLMQIANALNAYAATHGSYPPAIVYDSAGKAKHSWRVLILRELGEAALYGQYDFDEPWDSPANVALLGSNCPSVFISPGIAGGVRGVSETSYFLITGPGTIFPTSGPLGPQQVADDAASTLLVVESNTRAIEWTKPMDIDINKLNPRIGASGPDTIGGTHEGGATAVSVDGTPLWLPTATTPSILDAMITPAGGEQIDAQKFKAK